MPQHNYSDLTGQRFGRWTVIGRASDHVGNGSPPHKQHIVPRWLCRCSCGKEKVVRGQILRRGSSASCGCYRDEVARERYTTHGQTRTRVNSRHNWYGSPEYEMLRGAKQRAKQKGLAFDLRLEDIIVPATCPVLGIAIVAGAGGGFPAHNSPSLDRVTPTNGYVRNNVRVISHRANTLKRDGTIEEFEKIIAYMRKETT